jgi:AraC family transcriptional regulator
MLDELIFTKDNAESYQESAHRPFSMFATDQGCAAFKIDHRLYSPMHYCDHNHNDHIISINLGGPIDVAWRSQNTWQKDICGHGNIIRIVPFATKVENIWLQSLDSLSILLNRKFTDKMLETENFMFDELYNVCDPVLTNLIVDLYKITKVSSVSQQQFTDMFYAESICIAILLHIASLYSTDGKKRFSPKGKLSSHQLKTIIDYTWSTIGQNMKLTEMAKQVHLSPFHFARQFKRTVGISPYKFVLQLKIEHAKMVMKKCKGSIIDIAHELNFADQAHFSNTFKKVTGISPRRYLLHR